MTIIRTIVIVLKEKQQRWRRCSTQTHYQPSQILLNYHLVTLFSKTVVYFSSELEKYNFVEVEGGALFASTHSDKEVILNVINESGKNEFEKYFTRINNEIRLKKNMMPSMLTLNEQVIRQDCLCYLMERIPF